MGISKIAKSPVYIALAALITLWSTAAHADIRCIARPYAPPPISTYQDAIEDRFSGVASPMNTLPLYTSSNNNHPQWAPFVADLLSNYHERDIYCLAGRNVTEDDLDAVSDTGGGSLFVLFESGRTDNSLPTPPSDTTPGVDGETVIDAIRERFSISLSDCSNVGPTGPFERMPDEGWRFPCDELNDRRASKNRAAFSALAQSYTAPPNGERRAFQANAVDLGDGLASFLEVVTARDAVLSPIYKPRSIVFRDGKWSETDHTATSWLIAEMAAPLSTATLEASAEILQRASLSDLSSLQTAMLMSDARRDAILPLRRTATADWVERETIGVLCDPTALSRFVPIMPSETATRFEDARNVLCAVETIDGRLLFFEDFGPTSQPIDARNYLLLSELRRGVDEITRQILELRGDVSIQSETIARLTRLTGERNYRERLAALEGAKRRAEEAAESPDLLDIGKAIVSAASAISTGVGAFEAIDNVFDGLEGLSTLEDQIGHLWDERKELRKQAGIVGDQIGNISDAVDSLQRGDPSIVARLAAEIDTVTAARDAFLQEIDMTRETILARRAEIETLVLERTEALSRETVPLIADRTVSMNLFAHALPASSTAADRLRACARLLKEDADVLGSPNFALFSADCYSFGAAFEARQECAIRSGPIREIVALRLDGMLAYVAPSDRSHCLEKN